MASPAPVAARASRAFAAPRPVANGESARTRLGPRLRLAPVSRPGLRRVRDSLFFRPSTREALRRRGAHRDTKNVTAAAAEGDGSSAFWDAGDDAAPPAHRGYAPVPGFGEYYVPPKPPKPEKSARDGASVRGPDGAPLPPPPPPKRASKLLQEPAQAGIWERPGTPNGTAPEHTSTPRSFGDDLRAVRDPQFAEPLDGGSAQAAPASVTAGSVVPYELLNANDQNVSNDPELLRLRATYRLLTKMAGWLRYLFPVTGGLACWVAAGASLGGVFAKLVPQMVNVVNVLAFALAATLGASVCLGAFLVVALVGRALRNALFGNWESINAFDASMTAPVEPYDYPTHPGLLAQARAQSEQEMRYRAAQMEQARANEQRYEEYQRRFDPSRAVPAVSNEQRDASASASGFASGSAPVAADSYPGQWDGGSWGESDAYYPDASFDDVVGTLNRSRDAYEEEEEEEQEAFAARAPPKRKRVDLPIETLMGLGGETLSAVGSEWQTQKQREAASAGAAAGAANKAAGGNQRNDKKETGAGAPAPPPPQRQQQQPPPQPAQARAAPAPAPAPEPAPAPAPAPAPEPVMRGAKVDWNPDALMQDMGYGAPAPPPAPAAPAPAAPEKKNGGGWFGGFFGGGGGAKEAPAPAPVTPPPPPEPEVDPVLAMLGGGGARENPNAARAAAAAAKPPSGEYYLSPTQEQSKEQFEEMQRRRDEWNNRVQRAVKRKDGGRGEGARGDGT